MFFTVLDPLSCSYRIWFRLLSTSELRYSKRMIPLQTFGQLRRRKGRLSLVGLLLMLCAYFSYHAVQGERGLITLWHLEHEIEQAKQNLHLIETETALLDQRIARLSQGQVDADLLAELVMENSLQLPQDALLVMMPPQ